MFFLVLISLSAIFLIIAFHNKKLFMFLPFFVICVIMMGGNTYNPDYEIYYNIYYDSNFFTKDVGFGALVYISKNRLNFTLDEFRFIIVYICQFLIFFSVTKFSKSPLLFLLFFLSYQFFMQTVYFRNFISLSLFCFAFFNFTPNCKRNVFILILLFSVACLIQKSFLFIVGIYLISFILRRHKSVCIIYVVCSFLIGFLINIDSFYNLIINLLSSLNLSGLTPYLERVTRLGRIINWTFALLNLAFVYMVRKYSSKKLFSKQYIAYANYILYINVASLCALFLYVINPTFGRMLDNVIFISYFLFVRFINERFKRIKVGDKIFYLFILICILSVVFYIKIVHEGYFDTIFINIFINNWILGISSINSELNYYLTDMANLLKMNKNNISHEISLIKSEEFTFNLPFIIIKQ